MALFYLSVPVPVLSYSYHVPSVPYFYSSTLKEEVPGSPESLVRGLRRENYNYRIACLIFNYVPILTALFQDGKEAFLRREVPLHCSGLALFVGDLK